MMNFVADDGVEEDPSVGELHLKRKGKVIVQEERIFEEPLSVTESSRNLLSDHNRGGEEGPRLHLQSSSRNLLSDHNRGGEEGPRLHLQSSSANKKFASQFRRANTRSRLLDPRPPATSVAAAANPDDDDDDPFIEILDDDVEDIPEENRKKTVVSLLYFFMAVTSCLIPAIRNLELFDLPLWNWEFLLLFIVYGHYISVFLLRLIICLLELNILCLRQKLLYIVYEVSKATQKFIFVGMLTLLWHLVYHNNMESAKKKRINLGWFISKLVWSLFVWGILQLLKNLFVKFLTKSHHLFKYFDRIQQSLFHQYVIQTLADQQNAAARDTTLGNSGLIEVELFLKLNQTNVSSRNMRRMVQLVKYGVLTTFDQLKIENELKAQIAAKKIFGNVARTNTKYICLEDLKKFMKDDLALKTLILFQSGQDNINVSKRFLNNWMINAYRERRNLVLVLKDMKSSFKKLHYFCNFIVVAITIVVSVFLIFHIGNWEIIVVIGTQLLVFVFIFGDTLKEIFEYVIFLFVKHPFDIGDRCEVNGVQVVVEKINFSMTTFLTLDYEKVEIPNKLLATLPIANYNRSPDMVDSIDFSIPITTSPENIDILKNSLVSYVARNQEHFYPGPQIVLKDVEDLDRLRI